MLISVKKIQDGAGRSDSLLIPPTLEMKIRRIAV
jgi:hypothetical protein